MEKLSEQLAFGDLVGWTSAGSLTNSTGNAVDMKDNHRMVVMCIGSVSHTVTSTGTGSTTTTTATAVADLDYSVKIQASTSSAFGGTPTTVTTLTGSNSLTSTVTSSLTGGTAASTTKATASTTHEGGFEAEIWGEDVQAQRVAEDRYVRAVVSLSSGNNTPNVALASVQQDASRYKPSAARAA